MTEGAGKSFIDLTANIVSAYLSHNATPASEIPALINQIHSALLRVSTGRPEIPAEPVRPAVPLKNQSPRTIWYALRTASASNRSSDIYARNTT